jgi:hypothetical protein
MEGEFIGCMSGLRLFASSPSRYRRSLRLKTMINLYEKQRITCQDIEEILMEEDRIAEEGGTMMITGAAAWDRCGGSSAI